MRILIMAPDQLRTRVGGLRTQVERTTQELVNLGVEVDYFNPWDVVDFEQYDLCHIYSMNTPNYFKGLLVKDKMPVVFSSVMWRTSSRLLIRTMVELSLKIPYLVLNDVICCRKMSEWARVILPNTHQETQWLVEATGVDKQKCTVVPNGADDHFYGKTLNDLEQLSSILIDKEFVFCSSVISTRKNLEKLAKVCYELGFPLVIAGPVVDESVAEFIEIYIKKGADITLLGSLLNNSNELGYLYSKCKVFCLPSYYETPGISALEAGLRGANILVTEVGGAEDYFGSMAEYVNPDSEKNLSNKLRLVWEKKWTKVNREEMSNHIRKEFSWRNVAKLTLESYKEAIK
jgi:glycosyltransferase involved in cell wall biosynthesis